MILAPTARKLQQSHHHNAQRNRQREHTPSLETSSCSSSSSSGCYSHRRKHKRRHLHRRKHKRRHHRSRRYSLGNYYPGSITCTSSLPKSLQDCIRQGKFLMFDKLLLPQIVRPPLKLARVMPSRVSGMLLTYFHGSRHGTNTYV